MVRLLVASLLSFLDIPPGCTATAESHLYEPSEYGNRHDEDEDEGQDGCGKEETEHPV